MRVAYAGSPVASVAPLESLARSEHDVALVLTQPDRPRGRRGAPAATPVAEASDRLGLPVIKPASINAPEVVSTLDGAGLDALVVVAFGQILREGVLAPRPCINVHFSLLPAYRGAAPVERAIMDGVEETGVTIMLMDAGLDTGPTLAARSAPVGDADTGGALTERLSLIGAELLVESLTSFAEGRLEPRPQPEGGVSIAAKITAADRPIDPSRSARAVLRHVNALSPHIGASVMIDGVRTLLWEARLIEGAVVPAAGSLIVEDGRLLLGCADAALEIVELQPAGRGRVGAADFVRGWRGPLEFGIADG